MHALLSEFLNHQYKTNVNLSQYTLHLSVGLISLKKVISLFQ